MIRGTTPVWEFTLPFDTTMLATAWVTVVQRDVIVLDKELSECECDGDKLILRLTQADTLKLDAGTVAEVQIRVKTKEGEALASDIISISPDRVLKDGEI